MAKNKSAQKKLRDQLLSDFPNDDEISYEKLLDHQYLDQVIYESLRLNPPITFANRECSEDITIHHAKGKLRIEKGQRIFVPVVSIQQDPEYYHDPKEFIPERFDHGMKDFCDKGVLIPFSDGPRKCLGMRFALLQLKLAVYAIVRNFDITVNREMTNDELEIDPEELLMNVKKGGMWLNFKAIN